jgi:HlyD family secretion protein
VDKRNFLQKLMPGPPRMRRPSSPSAPTGAERKVWVLSDGNPQEMAVTVGATDGKRTEILQGDVAPRQAVIVDTEAAR